MTEILYWNINNFSRNKIADPNDHFNSEARFDYIVNDIFLSAIPDIFIIVEVFCRIREVGLQGMPIRANANVGVGLLTLLDRIRTDYGDEWCLVPPVSLGNYGFREAVAVFYNSARLQFIGPNLLSNVPIENIDRSRIPDQAAFNYQVGYNGLWRRGLPNFNLAQRTFPVNIPHLGPQPIDENRFAGQWEFYNIPMPHLPPPPGVRLNFPVQDSRSPFLTSFLEVGAGGRILNIYSVHTSPTNASQAVEVIAQIPAIQAPSAANTVDIIIGDFNVDPFTINPFNAANQLNPYRALIGGVNQFRIIFDPRFNGVVDPARKPYCMTHFLPRNRATPFRSDILHPPDPMHNDYPRFGYMGSMGGLNYQVPGNNGAYDNVFVRYAVGIPAIQHNATILNTITGSPYNALVPIPANVHDLTQGIACASTFQYALNLPGGTFDPTPGEPALFQQWDNFGKIHSTSDHLPLYIQV